MGDDFFVAQSNLFQQLTRDYHENFCSVPDERCDRGSFLCAKKVSFTHQNFRRKLLRRVFPQEDDWENLMCFDLPGKDLLENKQFMLKTSLRGSTLSAVKEQLNLEKKKGRSGIGFAAASVINANCSLFPNACLGFFRKVCEEVFQHPAWK